MFWPFNMFCAILICLLLSRQVCSAPRVQSDDDLYVANPRRPASASTVVVKPNPSTLTVHPTQSVMEVHQPGSTVTVGQESKPSLGEQVDGMNTLAPTSVTVVQTSMASLFPSPSAVVTATSFRQGSSTMTVQERSGREKVASAQKQSSLIPNEEDKVASVHSGVSTLHATGGYSLRAGHGHLPFGSVKPQSNTRGANTNQVNQALQPSKSSSIGPKSTSKELSQQQFPSSGQGNPKSSPQATTAGTSSAPGMSQVSRSQAIISMGTSSHKSFSTAVVSMGTSSYKSFSSRIPSSVALAGKGTVISSLSGPSRSRSSVATLPNMQVTDASLRIISSQQLSVIASTTGMSLATEAQMTIQSVSALVDPVAANSTDPLESTKLPTESPGQETSNIASFLPTEGSVSVTASMGDFSAITQNSAPMTMMPSVTAMVDTYLAATGAQSNGTSIQLLTNVNEGTFGTEASTVPSDSGTGISMVPSGSGIEPSIEPSGSGIEASIVPSGFGTEASILPSGLGTEVSILGGEGTMVPSSSGTGVSMLSSGLGTETSMLPSGSGITASMLPSGSGIAASMMPPEALSYGPGIEASRIPSGSGIDASMVPSGQGILGPAAPSLPANVTINTATEIPSIPSQVLSITPDEITSNIYPDPTNMGVPTAVNGNSSAGYGVPVAGVSASSYAAVPFQGSSAYPDPQRANLTSFEVPRPGLPLQGSQTLQISQQISNPFGPPASFMDPGTGSSAIIPSSVPETHTSAPTSRSSKKGVIVHTYTRYFTKKISYTIYPQQQPRTKNVQEISLPTYLQTIVYQGKPLGQLVSEILKTALVPAKTAAASDPPLREEPVGIESTPRTQVVKSMKPMISVPPSRVTLHQSKRPSRVTVYQSTKPARITLHQSVQSARVTQHQSVEPVRVTLHQSPQAQEASYQPVQPVQVTHHQPVQPARVTIYQSAQPVQETSYKSVQPARVTVYQSMPNAGKARPTQSVQSLNPEPAQTNTRSNMANSEPASNEYMTIFDPAISNVAEQSVQAPAPSIQEPVFVTQMETSDVANSEMFNTTINQLAAAATSIETPHSTALSSGSTWFEMFQSPGSTPAVARKQETKDFTEFIAKSTTTPKGRKMITSRVMAMSLQAAIVEKRNGEQTIRFNAKYNRLIVSPTDIIFMPQASDVDRIDEHEAIHPNLFNKGDTSAPTPKHQPFASSNTTTSEVTVSQTVTKIMIFNHSSRVLDIIRKSKPGPSLATARSAPVVVRKETKAVPRSPLMQP